MMISESSNFSLSSSTSYASIAVILFILAITCYSKSSKTSKLGLEFGRENGKPAANFREAIQEGYKTNAIFRLPTEQGETVVFPVRYLDEIKSLPNDVCNFVEDIHYHFQASYTGLDVHSDFIKAVKVDLTRNLAPVIDELHEELDYAMSESIPVSDNWIEITVYTTFLRVVALLTGRVFIGLPFSRNEQWISASINYTVQMFSAGKDILTYSPLLRPFFYPFLTTYRKCMNAQVEALHLLTPILNERLADMKLDSKPTRLIDWILRTSTEERANDLKVQIGMQLLSSFAAIHTTSQALSQVVFDLVAHPEYIVPLREEIALVTESDGGSLQKTSLSKLRKLDSFMRESQRMNPPALLSITRRMLKGYVLSDGTILEKGTNIALASGGVHMDSTIYQDPKTFDGYRAYKLRDKPGNGNKFQHTMTGPDSFTFDKLASSEDVPMRSLAEFTNTHFTGHGTHACPGRFFANAEMKLVLAYMLTHYDMKLKDGETRPMSEYQDVTVSANRNGKILIRARHDVGELS